MPLSEPTAAAIHHRRDVLDSADEVFKEWRETPHLVVVGTGLIANNIKGEVSTAVACRVLRSSPPGFA